MAEVKPCSPQHQPPKLPLYLVFNAFENPTVAPEQLPSFVEGWKYVAEYVQKNKRFLVTLLHENIDPEGKFGYINNACFDGPEFEAFSGPTKEFMEVAKKGLSPNQKKAPGGYEELATSTGKPLAPWLPQDTTSLWILTGFRVNKDNPADIADFEKNWKANSGADFILNAPKELGISKVGFYKKFNPSPGFDYFIRAEITGCKDDNRPAVEFLKKLREEKYPSCVTTVDVGVYKTPAEYILYPSAGKRDPPSGFRWIPE